MVASLIVLVEIGGLFLLSRQLELRLSRAVITVVRSRRVTVWVMSVLFLPGTLVHELAHLVVARLLLVKAGQLTLIPKIQGDHVVMGSVQIYPSDPVRRFVIGIAPVLVGLAVLFGAMWLAQRYQVWDSWIWRIGLGYLLFEIGNSMFSSSKDMEGALGLFLVMALIIGVAYWLGWRPSFEWVGPLLDAQEGVLTQAVQWLLWPLVIDAIAVAVLLAAGW